MYIYIYIIYIYIYICGISKSSKWDVQWDLNGIKMKKNGYRSPQVEDMMDFSLGR